jgi:hypothetical protein
LASKARLPVRARARGKIHLASFTDLFPVAILTLRPP